MYSKIINCLMEKGTDWNQINRINEKVWKRLSEVDSGSYKMFREELEGMLYMYTMPEAEEIVRNMRPYGEMWDSEQITDYVTSKGITCNYIEWYMVMNMMRNDFDKTANIFGHQDDMDFFYNLADDFINDIDGKPYKVGKYFML